MVCDRLWLRFGVYSDWPEQQGRDFFLIVGCSEGQRLRGQGKSKSRMGDALQGSPDCR
jgi:hypothetical protein